MRSSLIAAGLAAGAFACGAPDQQQEPPVSQGTPEPPAHLPPAPTWRALGGSDTRRGISDNARYSFSPQVALDSEGNPIVVWADSRYGTDNTDHQIYARRWDGQSWVELGRGSATGGGITDTPGHSTNERFGLLGALHVPCLAVDSENRPVVCWSQPLFADDLSLAGSEVFLWRWNGSKWEEMGGSASGGGVSGGGVQVYRPAVALDSQGNPIVSWSQGVRGNFDLYLRRWDGDRWTELDGSESDGGVSRSGGRTSLSHALIADSDDRPIVAWIHDAGGNTHELHHRRWSGAQWLEMEASSATSGVFSSVTSAHGPCLAASRDGRVALAWMVPETTFRDHLHISHAEAHLRLWDGERWTELDGSATGEGISDVLSKPVLPEVHDFPMIGVTAMRRSGARITHMAFEADGDLLVFWEEWRDRRYEGGTHLFARRWDGTAWSPIWEGSDTLPGIIQPRAELAFVSIDTDDEGRIALAWSAHDGVDAQQIYVLVTEMPDGSD